MRLSLALGSLVVLVFSATIAIADNNAFTGLPATGDYPHVPLPQVDGATPVLWDITHGVTNEYEPTGAFAALVASLPSYAFATTDAGIDNIDLSPYAILVICMGSAWDSPYGPSEVTAVQDFAANGGAVLILGDNDNVRPDHINPIAEAFGTTTGINSIFPTDLFFSNFSDHPIFTGINELFMALAGGLSVSPPSTVQAQTDDGSDVLIALVESPCVVITGDINIWAESFAEVDNAAFAANVFAFLRDCGPVPVERSTWGAIKSAYR